MVGRGQGRAVGQAQHQLGTIAAELLGQGQPGLEAVEQTPVGKVQGDADLHAQRRGGLARFGQADFRSRGAGRGLAVGQVDDPHAVSLPDQRGQRAAAADLHVVGVRADGDHVQRQFVHREFFNCSRHTPCAVAGGTRRVPATFHPSSARLDNRHHERGRDRLEPHAVELEVAPGEVQHPDVHAGRIGPQKLVDLGHVVDAAHGHHQPAASPQPLVGGVDQAGDPQPAVADEDGVRVGQIIPCLRARPRIGLRFFTSNRRAFSTMS